jgi:hypothetical protein
MWRMNKHAKGIAKDVHREWLRLLADVDPEVLAVQRAAYSATLTCPRLLLSPEVYERQHVVADLKHYRAAVAATLQPGLIAERARARLMHSHEARMLRSLGEANGLELTFIPSSTPELSASRMIDEIEDWRGLFSPDGTAYRSLNRTLEQLPGGVPARSLGRLRSVRLARPYTDRVELLTLLAAADWNSAASPWTYPRPNYEVFTHASRVEITRAMARVGEFTRNPLSPRRTHDIEFMVRFLSDCPDKHNGSLGGLVRKAIRYHRERLACERSQMLMELSDRTVEPPPISPPGHPEITFLDTVPAIVEEGARMNNCIGSFARQATRGAAFVFHVERDGQCATVLVGHDGGIVDAGGPGNKRNAAERWGRRTLAYWGKDFPLEREHPRYRPMLDDLVPF